MHIKISLGPLYTAGSVDRNLEASKNRVFKILHLVLRMFTYRFQRILMMQPGDEQQLFDFPKYFLIRYDEVRRWSLHILWTDEAHLILTRNVNSKNYVHWAVENSQDMARTHLHFKLKWPCVATTQAHLFSNCLSSNRSLPLVWKHAPSQLLGVQQCWRNT